MSKQTVLIVEDEKDIRKLLTYSLENEGFTVISSGNGTEGLELAQKKLPDIILLDLMLPGIDGLQISKILQRNPQTAVIPILMLTAKGEEVDRIVGFELGAADYVVKPFSVREVILRVKAILRRKEVTSDAATLLCGLITLDLPTHTVKVRDKTVDLTITEFRLLENLVRYKEIVRTREQLLDVVWGYSFEGYARTVDTHIRRLRGKLGAEAECVETVWGMGYRATEGDS
ncbi:response regulator transcription factor [Desulfovibrio sp. OttesenSCG-928-F20]|nr:response regulator transcription factor [Desulfovibrio sp. OttesenSCG-928-M16]MDL2291151.1 response regulator transcription factor [Desulfovibrio sp. OttesenSCG-928-F20]